MLASMDSMSVAVRVEATNIVPAIRELQDNTTQTANNLRHACISATVTTYSMIRPIVVAK